MKIICRFKGHEWGEWGDWEEEERILPRSAEKIDNSGYYHIPSYQYVAKKSRIRKCERCGAKDSESESIAKDSILEKTTNGRFIPADVVHNSEELVELVDRDYIRPKYVFPPREQDSFNAHMQAKERDAPVRIGDYVTAGIEDLSEHHSGGLDPMIRHEGYVIFVKKSPNNLELGDAITAKITSFNKGDSANAVFIRRDE